MAENILLVKANLNKVYLAPAAEESDEEIEQDDILEDFWFFSYVQWYLLKSKVSF